MRDAHSARWLIPLLCCLSMLLALSPGRAAAAEGADRPYFTDLGQFNYANFLMGEKDCRAAAMEFGRLIESFPASPLIPEAQFRMAEAYLCSGQLREAETQFGLFASNFVDSPFAIVAEMKMREARDRRAASSRTLPLHELRRRARPALRAVQVMLFEGRTAREVASELDRLKGSGIDTVILRAFHNSGDRYYPAASRGERRGVYFATAHAPVVDDMLPSVIEMAHARGLKVFAWMTTRYADYGIEGEAETACASYDMARGGYARCKGLDLFNDKAVERLERIYSDLAANDIDGVLFQDDLVLRHNEGLGPAAAAMFERDTGERLDPEALYWLAPDGRVHYTPLFWKWAAWKNRRLVAVAGRLMAVVKARRPQAAFAINLMYESLTSPAHALAWLSQDLGEAMRADFDYYSIMAYHRQMGEELDKPGAEIMEMIKKMALDAAATVGEPERVLIKVQTVDWNTGAPLPDSEVVGLIREIRGARGVSIAVVPYRPGFPFSELAAAGMEAGREAAGALGGGLR